MWFLNNQYNPDSNKFQTMPQCIILCHSLTLIMKSLIYAWSSDTQLTVSSSLLIRYSSTSWKLELNNSGLISFEVQLFWLMWLIKHYNHLFTCSWVECRVNWFQLQWVHQSVVHCFFTSKLHPHSFLPICWNVEGVSNLIATWGWFDLIECLGLVLFWCFWPHEIWCFICLFDSNHQSKKPAKYLLQDNKHLIYSTDNTFDLYAKLSIKTTKSKKKKNFVIELYH